MAINRIWYGVRVAGVSQDGAEDTYTNFVAIHGLQSLDTSQDFGLQLVSEMGQGAPYDYTEQVPEITVSMEKVLDGTSPIYNLAFGDGTTIMTASEATCSMVVQTCASNALNAAGTPELEATMTGLYLSSLGYNFVLDGPSTETIEFVGNHLLWTTGTKHALISGTLAWGSDAPVSGVVLREDVDISNSTLPTADLGSNTVYQSINISANLGREDVNQLGSRVPYMKTVQLPVEVTTDITVLSLASGIQITGVDTSCSTTALTANRQITVQTCQGLTVNLGAYNRLRTISENGGGVDGSNATVTYSYVTYNSLTVSHTEAPAAA